MQFLALSIGALALGPALGRIVRRNSFGLHLLDAFVFTAILSLSLLHLVPECLAQLGLEAFPTLFVGLIVPQLVERKLHRGAGATHLTVVLLAVFGLLIHATIDGAALRGVAEVGTVSAAASLSVSWSIVLHRIPEGLVLWWSIQPVMGAAPASLALGLVGAGTVFGYFGPADLVHGLQGRFAAHALAFLTGSILHVVFHQGMTGRSGSSPGRPVRLGAALGAVVALLAVGFLGPEAEGTGPGARNTFMKLLAGSAPALLIGFAAAGLVRVLIPEAGLRWLRRGSILAQSLKGMVIGLPLPICSCGVVPVYESLVRRGVPVAAGIAFLVATPELGVDALLLSIPLLGTPIALLRLAAAVFVAVVSGLILGVLVRGRSGGDDSDAALTDAPRATDLAGRLRETAHYGLVELPDQIGPWILLGLLIAALLEPSLDLTRVAALPVPSQVLLMTLLGLPVYVCATGATPVAAVLLAKSMNPGAVIAFLLAGPVTNITTFALLNRLHGRRAAGLFMLVMVGACVSAGCLIGIFPGSLPVPALSGTGTLEGGSGLAVAVLGLIFAGSLYRQGPRGMARQILTLAESSEHAHEDCDSPGEASPAVPAAGAGTGSVVLAGAGRFAPDMAPPVKPVPVPSSCGSCCAHEADDGGAESGVPGEMAPAGSGPG